MHATPTNLGPLDRLPASVRHLLLAVLPILVSWLGTDVVPRLQGHGTLLAVATLALQVAGLWGTPVTRQYGAGSPPPAWQTEPDPTAPVPDPTVPSPREPSADETDQDIPEAA